jgi:hypothetical protein
VFSHFVGTGDLCRFGPVASVDNTTALAFLTMTVLPFQRFLFTMPINKNRLFKFVAGQRLHNALSEPNTNFWTEVMVILWILITSVIITRESTGRTAGLVVSQSDRGKGIQIGCRRDLRADVPSCGSDIERLIEIFDSFCLGRTSPSFLNQTVDIIPQRSDSVIAPPHIFLQNLVDRFASDISIVVRKKS